MFGAFPERAFQERKWDTLIEKIKEGFCTPFIGAGACSGVLPLAKELAETLLDTDFRDTGRVCPLDERDRLDLSRVAQYLAVSYDSLVAKLRIARLLKCITDIQEPEFSRSDEPHRALAHCNLPIYLTTNYDDFMFRALKKEGASPIREYARWTKNLLTDTSSMFDNGVEPTRDNPLIFHLHGMLENPRSIVVTEDDYLDFLVNWSKDLSSFNTRKRAMIPAAIRNAFKNNTLLFLGYSFSDMNLRVILRGLVGSLETSERKLDVAVQVPTAERPALDEYIDARLSGSLAISVFWGTAQQFSDELQRRLSRK